MSSAIVTVPTAFEVRLYDSSGHEIKRWTESREIVKLGSKESIVIEVTLDGVHSFDVSPVKWLSSDRDISPLREGAFDLRVMVVNDLKANSIEGAIPTHAGTEFLSSLTLTSTWIVSALDHLVTCREHARKLQEESLKRMMEGLADEKKALEERLRNEKDAIISESLGLAEQLKDTQKKLQETKELLEQELRFRAQLQDLVTRLEAEKRQSQDTVQNQYEEIDRLKSDLGVVQSAAQKDSVLLDNLRRQSLDQEAQLSRLQTQLEEALEEKRAWEEEREELVGQISILTEERDVARGNEENLFEQLRDKTMDLDKLQESYVDMSDRCNDYRDEISELRERFDAMKEYQDSVADLISANKQAASSYLAATTLVNSASEPTLPHFPPVETHRTHTKHSNQALPSASDKKPSLLVLGHGSSVAEIADDEEEKARERSAKVAATVEEDYEDDAEDDAYSNDEEGGDREGNAMQRESLDRATKPGAPPRENEDDDGYEEDFFES
jgi:myosin heavy subunit